MVSDKFKTIYVTPFINKIDITKEVDTGSKYRIYRPMIETEITKYVNNKYLFDGNLRPAKEGLADLILKGEVVEFRKDPLRYDSDDNVSEYRLNLVVNISLWDGKEKTLVWQENNFTGDTHYFATGTQQKSEDTAIVDAYNDLARRIVERTVEQW
ncbi:MAG: LptE family protein [Candidatus Omnitrophica bacterium]|nr:LptE family protein [Candidatus Omnitrophota bacterium]